MNEELNLPKTSQIKIGADVTISKRSLIMQITVLGKSQNIFLVQLQEIIFDWRILIKINTCLCITVSYTVLTTKF